MSTRTVIKPYGITLIREEDFTISADVTSSGEGVEIRIGHTTIALNPVEASHLADVIQKMVEKAKLNYGGRP